MSRSDFMNISVCMSRAEYMYMIVFISMCDYVCTSVCMSGVCVQEMVYMSRGMYTIDCICVWG